MTENKIPEKVFSVGEYIEAINIALDRFKVKITGEVTEVTLAVSGHCYFTVKDKQANNTLDCIIWKYNYQMCGVKIETGMEIILAGKGKIYNATGRFSFIADTIELKGEGALKKAYEKLKAKLSEEGLFAVERKKPLPQFPQNIGVITSKKGAVINDLLNNLGKFGFKVKMIDSRVEGQEAVKDLLNAIESFKEYALDVLLIMRGGGSLESLQPFNNEALVRATINLPFPVLAAIGHDKDVPLLALTADFACSTPTAAANTLNKTWEQAPLKINQSERIIYDWFSSFFNKYKKYESQLENYIVQIEQAIKAKKLFLDNSLEEVMNTFSAGFKALVQKVYYIAKTIKAYDPQNNLVLGYCLARKNGKLIKSVKSLAKGEGFDLQMADGIVKAKHI